MSTERTDQYPEVSGEDAGLVPPQGAAKSEWPKKIRTLTASELDRLTIDGLGRFYWDGKLVNYDAHPSRLQQPPVDLDQHAMDLLDRTARELSDPNAAPAAGEIVSVEPQTVSSPSTAPTLAAPPTDQLVPATSVLSPAPTPVVEARRQEAMAAARSETVKVKLTKLQSLGVFVLVLGLIAGALGIAASSFVAAHDWACKAGVMKSYCPLPPPAPMPPPARPEIPS